MQSGSHLFIFGVHISTLESTDTPFLLYIWKLMYFLIPAAPEEVMSGMECLYLTRQSFLAAVFTIIFLLCCPVWGLTHSVLRFGFWYFKLSVVCGIQNHCTFDLNLLSRFHSPNHAGIGLLCLRLSSFCSTVSLYSTTRNLQ